MTKARVDAVSEAGVVRVAIAGEIDLANAQTVEGQIVAAITNHASRVTLDLTDVAYVDSAGLRIMFSLAARLSTLQIGLGIVAPAGSPARRVIELSGLAAFVTLEP